MNELTQRIATAAFGNTASVGKSGAGQTVILAGHFAVFTAGGRASDLLDEPRAVDEHTDMVGFTRESWTAACDVLATGPGGAISGVAPGDASMPAVPPSPGLLLLVDDIQFVQPALPDRAARERLAAALAADYLRRTSTMPAYHQRELNRRGIAADRIVRCCDESWLFSERALRSAAVQRIRHATREGSRHPTAPTLHASTDGSRIVVRDPSLGEHTLVHSGHTSCAGGYLELVMRLHERGVRRLVAIVPRRCLGPATVGAQLARTLFGATTIEVVNIPFGCERARGAPDQLVRAATG